MAYPSDQTWMLVAINLETPNELFWQNLLRNMCPEFGFHCFLVNPSQWDYFRQLPAWEEADDDPLVVLKSWIDGA